MLNISKVESLINDKGWKKAYFCRLLDHSRTWIDDWKRGRGLPDENMLHVIADRLDTTVEYLTDKTDIKNKPSTKESLADKEKILVDAFRLMTDDQKELMLQMAAAKSAEIEKSKNP